MKKKTINNLKTYSSTKPSNLCWPNQSQKSSYCFRIQCKWVCKWWYWTSNYQSVVLNMIKFHWIDEFPQKYSIMTSRVQWIQRTWSKKIKFKIVRVMKFTFKTRYSHLLLSITFNDEFWRSHLGILHRSTKHNNRDPKQSIQTTFHYYFRAFDQNKTMDFKIPEHFLFIHFTWVTWY